MLHRFGIFALIVLLVVSNGTPMLERAVEWTCESESESGDEVVAKESAGVQRRRDETHAESVADQHPDRALVPLASRPTEPVWTLMVSGCGPRLPNGLNAPLRN